jgi:hypothetical protein
MVVVAAGATVAGRQVVTAARTAVAGNQARRVAVRQ